MGWRQITLATGLALSLAAFGGGTKLVKDAAPVSQTTAPVAQSADEQLSAKLNWVIVRNAPGSCAKNADWDEHLLRASNESNEPLQITSVTLTDFRGFTSASHAGRKLLVKASKQT